MSTSKHIDKICIAVIAFALIISILVLKFSDCITVNDYVASDYENHLFTTDSVHTIDIEMDDWDSFLEGCESETYSSCDAVIDGEKYTNVAIRAKGNTSLSNVKSMDSNRYSFKLEFDHYDDGKSYYGLDKLCLNNIIQDNTMMKDFLVYQMMRDFGVDTPLCSYVYITVNGQDWGLYLAVEGVEDSFLARNYGSDYGDLYKPDSMSFGGGRGNGQGFDMKNFDFGDPPDDASSTDNQTSDGTTPGSFPGGFAGRPGGPPNMDFQDFSGEFPDRPSDDSNDSSDNFPGRLSDDDSVGSSGSFPDRPSEDDSTGSSDSFPDRPSEDSSEDTGHSFSGDKPEGMPEGMPGGDMPGGKPGGGMGSDDVKLKYTDDDPDSYTNIFDSAKTVVTNTDKSRLIESLKNLSEYTDLEDTLDIDEVLRYFVVHNFVCNGDSYTGEMIHNYYLYEEDGQLSMIPWDYNLAFGTFTGGNAGDTINTSIDDPLSGDDYDDRPMIGWIFSDEEYTSQYHNLFAKFIEEWFVNGKLNKLINSTADMIRPYVEKDPTKFCTTEQFEEGVDTITQFVNLRAEAVTRQLNGNTEDVDASDLDLSLMGTMNNGNGGGPKGSK